MDVEPVASEAADPAGLDYWIWPGQPPEPANLAEHRIHRKQILGGLTHEYYIAA
jgi:hypothetical protein